MKKSIFTFLITLITSISFAQQVVVSEANMEINKVSRPGLETSLDLDKKIVKDEWKKFLKEFGKVETSGNEFIIKEAKIPSISPSPVSIVSTVEKGKKGTTVFIAIDMGDKWITRSTSSYVPAEKLLHDFGVTAYKNEINEQIKEAEKELKKAEKAKEKSEKEGEDLSNKLNKNRDDKIKLENDLKKNEEDKIQLEKDIDANKKDQENKKDDLNKAKDSLDKIKSKLDKVY